MATLHTKLISWTLFLLHVVFHSLVALLQDTQCSLAVFFYVCECTHIKLTSKIGLAKLSSSQLGQYAFHLASLSVCLP